MFSELIVAYLFFGGAGAATLLLVCLSDVLRGSHALVSTRGVACAANSRDSWRRTKAYSVAAGLTFLCFGVLCLIYDLGRLDRLMLLFARPSVTYITAGTFALALLVVSGFILFAVSFFEGLHLFSRMVRAVEILAAILSVFVMIYTGLLLASVGAAIELWHSALVPILFLLSALSCGCAVILIVAMFAGETDQARRVTRSIFRLDALAILGEAIVASLYVIFVAGDVGQWDAVLFWSEDETVLVSWWIGFVACGIVFPLLSEVLMLHRKDRFDGTLACIFVGLSILMGGWCLRWSIVEGASLQDMQLSSPSQSAY